MSLSSFQPGYLSHALVVLNDFLGEWVNSERCDDDDRAEPGEVAVCRVNMVLFVNVRSITLTTFHAGVRCPQ